MDKKLFAKRMEELQNRYTKLMGEYEGNPAKQYNLRIAQDQEIKALLDEADRIKGGNINEEGTN